MRPPRLFILTFALGMIAVACGDSAVTTTSAVPPATTAPPAATTAPATTIPPATTVPPTTTTVPPPPTTAAPTTTVPPATTTTVDGPIAIDVAVSEGQVEGEDRYEVEGGAEVRIVITADVTDEVHVHGYDIFGDVTPDAAAVITFTADIPGIFEVELEGAHTQLFELVVGA